MRQFWTYSTGIPFEDIADLLSDEDYEKYEPQYKVFAVGLRYRYQPAEPDVDIPLPYMELEDWEPLAEYPSPILDALDKYIWEMLPEKYTNAAMESYDDYCDYLKYEL